MNKAKAHSLGIFGRRKRYRFAIDLHRHRIGAHNTRDQLDQCAFARAIFAHQRMHFACPQIKINGFQGSDARIRF